MPPHSEMTDVLCQWVYGIGNKGQRLSVQSLFFRMYVEPMCPKVRMCLNVGTGGPGAPRVQSHLADITLCFVFLGSGGIAESP